jgi:phage regulator Rha-like protein
VDFGEQFIKKFDILQKKKKKQQQLTESMDAGLRQGMEEQFRGISIGEDGGVPAHEKK